MDNQIEVDFRTLTELMADSRIIDKEQKDLLNRIFAKSLPYYQTGSEREEKLKQFLTLLSEITWIYVEGDDPGISKLLSEELRKKALELPAPQFDVADLMTDKLPLNVRLSIFVHIRLLNSLSQRKVSPTKTFALFPNILCRLFFPAQTIGKVATVYLKNQLTAIQRALNSLPSPTEAVKSVLALAGSIGRRLVTDWHTGGPIDFENIYELGPTMYRDEAKSMFIFSRTPGLVIPSEYYGDENNNYYRRIYFEQGFLSDSGKRLKKYYQWNRSTTALALYENYKRAEQNGIAEQYQSEAARVLARFLFQPNLEITEGIWERNPKVARFKQTFTLMNQSSIVRTSRDKASKSINKATLLGGYFSDYLLAELLSSVYSLQVEPRWDEPSNKTQPHSIPFVIKKIYDEDAAITVKRMGETLDEKAALEVVKRLIELGKQEFSKRS